MGRIFAVFVFAAMVLLPAAAGATPRLAVISAYSASSWLPAEVVQRACEVIDDSLVAGDDAILFDGAKTADKREMARRLAPDFADYVVTVRHSGFYDPPFAARVTSDAKPTDTVAVVILDYAVYITAADRWASGRVYQRTVFAGAAVPQEAACLEATRQALPKLAEKLAAIIK